jgi:hypothetical protein
VAPQKGQNYCGVHPDVKLAKVHWIGGERIDCHICSERRDAETIKQIAVSSIPPLTTLNGESKEQVIQRCNYLQINHTGTKAEMTARIFVLRK